MSLKHPTNASPINFGIICNSILFDLYTTLTDRKFYLSLLLLPLMFFFFVAVKYSQRTTTEQAPDDTTATIAVLDPGGLLKRLGYCTDDTFEEDLPLTETQALFDPFEGQKSSLDDPVVPMGMSVVMYCERFIEDATNAVLNGTVQVAILIPRDYRVAGKLTIYSENRREPLVSHAVAIVSTMLRQAIAEPLSFDPLTRARLTQEPDYVMLDPWGERFVGKLKRTPTPTPGELDDFNVSANEHHTDAEPVARKSARQLATFWGLMVISLAGTAGFSCTRSERISHLIEIVLSSVASEEYILARVVSTSFITGLQSCLQVLTYAAAEYCVRPAVAAPLPPAGALPTPAFILLIVIVALSGSVFTNLLGVTLGVIGKPNVDDKVSPFIALIMTYLFIGVVIILVSAPKSIVATLLTYIPLFTAPAIIIRTTSGSLSLIEGILAMVFLFYCISRALVMASKTMNVCLSLDGQPLSLSSIKQAIQQASK